MHIMWRLYFYGNSPSIFMWNPYGIQHTVTEVQRKRKISVSLRLCVDVELKTSFLLSAQFALFLFLERKQAAPRERKTSFLLSAQFALFLYVFQCKLYVFTCFGRGFIPNFADVETKMPQTTVTGCPTRNTGNEEKQTSNYRYPNPKNLISKATTKISYHNQSPN